MNESLKASVIIPTYNRYEILKRVLQFYREQTISKERFELIIVDDGGNDSTPLLFKDMEEMDYKTDINLKKYSEKIVTARHYDLKKAATDKGDSLELKYVRIKKSGRSVARNIGIGLSSYPLLIFADDDIFVEPEFVEKHLEAHSKDKMLIVKGRVIHTSDLANPLSTHWKPKDVNTAFLATGNASVFKEQVKKAGLFDEKYSVYGWEDFDLGIHLKENGLKSIRRKIYGYHYDPPQKVLLPAWIYNKEKERGFTAVYFYKKHPLGWVKRFTLVESRLLDTIFQLLGRKNWFLARENISIFKGLLRLIIRYKGYFDGVREGKRHYMLKDCLEKA